MRREGVGDVGRGQRPLFPVEPARLLGFSGLRVWSGEDGVTFWASAGQVS